MQLKMNAEKLKELMRDFHVLTGIKIVFFDTTYAEILSYPEGHSAFCTLMHSHDTTRPLCLKSNADSFEQCKKTGKLIVYQCHAGLVEATAPLKDDGVIIGYIMFGQIASSKERKRFLKSVFDLCEQYEFDHAELEQALAGIKYKTRPQILAAAKILEACTYYVLLNDLISQKKGQFINRLNEYIEEHISEDITADTICDELNVCRTKLYELFNQYFNTGIAEYVRQKRLSLARHYLENTDDDIALISERIGFNDYNYFCRVFKKEHGCSAGKYRKEFKS